MKQSGFNPHARWDRHTPQTEEAPNPEELNEKIEVLAWFRKGKLEPQLFIWNNKEYKIKKVTYNWQERRGRETISFFSVDTGNDIYQISFNNTSLTWQIDKIIE
jgi:hypothetical protein